MPALSIRWTELENPDCLPNETRHILYDNSLESSVGVSLESPIEMDLQSDSVFINEGSCESITHSERLIVAGQNLPLYKLLQLLKGFDLDETKIHIQLNAFHKVFAESVVDILLPQHLFTKLDNAHLIALGAQYHVDLMLGLNTKLSTPGLLVMDMDSTIIDIECIDEIAALAGVKKQVSEVTERAMRGEIDFSESLHHRVQCLAGVPVNKLHSIRRRLPFMPGFQRTMEILKAKGWTLAIASGGFTFFADYIKQSAGLDYAFSNQLGESEGKLTGRVEGDVVDAERKASVLQELQQQHKIKPEQTLAIGDGANDLVMMRKADAGIAYHAKVSVQEQADSAINIGGFNTLLYLLRE